MELWELSARERIRDTLAGYNWSGDAMRLAELAESFCEDGELELRGGEPVKGRAAIVEFLGGAMASPNARAEASSVKRIVRHNVANIRFTDVAPARGTRRLLFHCLHGDRPRPLRPLPRCLRAGRTANG